MGVGAEVDSQLLDVRKSTAPYAHEKVRTICDYNTHLIKQNRVTMLYVF